MCCVAVKYFSKYGWAGVKNRDRNYPTKIEIIQTNKEGLQRLVIDDTLSRWTEGVNEFGVAIISASFSVKRDEKEGEDVAKGRTQDPGAKYKKTTNYYSPDGKKIRKALTKTNAKDTIMLLQEEELAGATYAFDEEQCFLLEGGWNVSKEEATKDNPREFKSSITEISKEVGWSCRTNHGILIPELGYSENATDPKFKRARQSSESRLQVIMASIPLCENPRDLLGALAECPNKEDQFMNPIRRGDPTKGEMVTTGQIMIVSGDRTLHYRPLHSSIEFDYHKLNNFQKAKTFFEVISDRSLLKMYEGADASPSPAKPDKSDSGKAFTIYCDLDDVLIDFTAAMKKLSSGLNFKDTVDKLGQEGAWELINSGGSDWWANLPWSQDGKNLWAAIKKYKPVILTAGATQMTGETAAKGKRQWCLKNLGKEYEVVVTDTGVDKKFWAAKNHILIDDMPANIIPWRQKGGIGIVHKNTKQTLAELQHHLDAYK